MWKSFDLREPFADFFYFSSTIDIEYKKITFRVIKKMQNYNL